MTENERRIANVEKMAEKSFADHEITLRHMSECGRYAGWRCKSPGSGFYLFNITVEPGRIFVTGDVGTLVVERAEDMLGWCRGAIDSIDYFAEKVAEGMICKTWSSEAAKESLEGIIENAEDYGLTADQLDGLYEIIDDLDFLDQHDFYKQIDELGIPDIYESLSCDAWHPRFLWCRQAIKWFLDHYDPETHNTKEENGHETTRAV